MITRNPVVTEIIDRAADLALPGWYLTSGCLFQTVWNVLSGFEPTHGIKDYDMIYFDDADLSWEAEDAVIRACAERFWDLPADVEVRNQARVHLWYPAKFGIECEPFLSSEEGIDSFPAAMSCLGVRRVDGRLQTYAPHGFSDLFDFIVRPNPVRAPREVYEAKTARWAGVWPRLRVFPWPL